MSEWKEYKLKYAPLSIIDGDRGKNYPNQNEFSNTGYCLFLSTKNVRHAGFDFSDCLFITKEKDQLLRKGKLCRYDLVLTTRGTIGNIGFYSDVVKFENVRINSGMIIIRANQEFLLPIFNFYLFRHLQKDFSTFTTGSAQPQLPIRDLNEIKINLPPLPEQKAIASVLSSLDDKIDLLHRQNATLEKMAETLFRQWFIEGANECWKVGKISDLIDFNPVRKISKGKIAPYLEMANLSTIGYAPTHWHSREFSAGSKFINGDTLLARITPCLENGKAAFIDFLEEEQVGWGSTEFIVLRSKKNLHPFFAYAVAKNSSFKDFAEGCMQGSSGRQRIDIENLKSYEIATPSIDVINDFNNFCLAITPKLKANQIQIGALTSLRDSLLPKLMSGEVKINF